MTSASNTVLIVCWHEPSPDDRRAAQIAEFMGARAQFACLDTESDLEAVRQLLAQSAAVTVRAHTLANLTKKLDERKVALTSLFASAVKVFVFGFETNVQHESILREISGNTFCGVRELSKDATLKISAEHRELCGQFSGLAIKHTTARDVCFERAAGDKRGDTFISADGKSFFHGCNDSSNQFFLLAGGELASLDEKVSCEAGLLPWFSRLIPFMMFLRNALGNRLWHSDLSQACFLIDDPLLEKEYGFLNYQKLLEIMGRERFSSCIAFIPWNYTRSRSEIASRISVGTGSLSLCVHGCDHTGAEFATSDPRILAGKARRALERMRQHSRKYNTPFDEVMVFPQGLFSREALKTLESCGYLAAVNTDLSAVDDHDSLTLRHLLDVAITRIDGCALFWRHYPREIAEFAFDLFLGKPIFIVEHHGYFRKGYDLPAEFMRRLNQLDNLEWKNPAAICSRACLKREMPDGSWQVRFFTNKFELTNNANVAQSYVLVRDWPDGRAVPRILVYGQACPAEVENGALQIRISLDPGQTGNIEINSRPETDVQPWPKMTRTDDAKIFLRRFLSEFRDNYIETHPTLSHFVSNTRKLATSMGLFKARVGSKQAVLSGGHGID